MRRRLSEIALSPFSTLNLFYRPIPCKVSCAVVRFLDSELPVQTACGGQRLDFASALRGSELQRLSRGVRSLEGRMPTVPGESYVQSHCSSPALCLTRCLQSTATSAEVVRPPASSRQASGAAALKKSPSEHHEHDEHNAIVSNNLPTSRIDERKVIVGWDTHTWSR